MKRLAPLLAWMVALATLAGATYELHGQRDSAAVSTALALIPHFAIKTTPLILADYQAIQKKTTGFGSVSLVAEPDALIIQAARLADYSAWRLTIDQVLLDNPGISWRIDTLCSGFCALDEAHRAVLKGTRQSGEI